MSHLKKNGSTRKWRQIRAQILKRDYDTCYICEGFANEVDHIVPRSRGGTDEPDNLAAICKSCNSDKSDKLTAFFLQKKATPAYPCSNFSPKGANRAQMSEIVKDIPESGFERPDTHG